MAKYLNKRGKFYLKRNGKWLKINPNQEFTAEPYEISNFFMDTIQLLKDTKKVVVESVEEVPENTSKELKQDTVSTYIEEENKPSYRVKAYKKGWYDIVATYSDGTEKVLNTKHYRQSDAKKALEKLVD